MKKQIVPLSLALAVLMAALPVFSISVAAQDPQTQAQATGADAWLPCRLFGWLSRGGRDGANQTEKDFHSKAAYQQADRAYSPNFGSLDEYRSGYKQGFEVGYNDGFDRRNFDSSIPADLKVRESNDDSQVPVMTNTNRPADNTSRPADNPSRPADNTSRPLRTVRTTLLTTTRILPTTRARRRCSRFRTTRSCVWN
jgi:hypothetical protein